MRRLRRRGGRVSRRGGEAARRRGGEAARRRGGESAEKATQTDGSTIEDHELDACACAQAGGSRGITGTQHVWVGGRGRGWCEAARCVRTRQPPSS